MGIKEIFKSRNTKQRDAANESIKQLNSFIDVERERIGKLETDMVHLRLSEDKRNSISRAKAQSIYKSIDRMKRERMECVGRVFAYHQAIKIIRRVALGEDVLRAA